MAKFMFIYRDPVTKEAPEISPEEMQASIQKWEDWLGKGQQDGWCVAMGDALGPDGKVVQADKTVTDGPYLESKEMIGGYSVIEAADYDAACQHAMGCPIYEVGGVVEVRAIVDFSEQP